MSSRDPLTRGEKQRISRLRPRLLEWYDANGRDFPWRRESADNFERICVEVLLQRTRAETVARVYGPFFGRFKCWQDIADASISELEYQFKPIGLWKRRARSIKGLAIYAADRGGLFPESELELDRIPAVGQYVKNAILMFQHGKPRPLLDVNMARVLERYIRPRRLADIRHDPWLQEAAHWLVRHDDPAKVNWAALDLASAICKSRHPLCSTCALERRCSKANLLPKTGNCG
ncbi:hypothetical protein [Minwuia sp. IMCC3077]